MFTKKEITQLMHRPHAHIPSKRWKFNALISNYMEKQMVVQKVRWVMHLWMKV